MLRSTHCGAKLAWVDGIWPKRKLNCGTLRHGEGDVPGSRGDKEPFLAKAEELLEEEHEVALCMPEQFQGLASEVSATWFGMDRAFLDLIESPEDPNQRPVHHGRLTSFQLPPLSRIGILDTRRRCQMAPPLRIHPM